MKTMALTAITALLTSALILPAITPVQAATIEDGRSQLSPKSFGQKTKILVSSSTANEGLKPNLAEFDNIKKEEIKIFKKANEYFKALQFMKTYYRL